jgi:hypothetical protein
MAREAGDVGERPKGEISNSAILYAGRRFCPRAGAAAIAKAQLFQHDLTPQDYGSKTAAAEKVGVSMHGGSFHYLPPLTSHPTAT